MPHENEELFFSHRWILWDLLCHKINKQMGSAQYSKIASRFWEGCDDHIRIDYFG